MSPADFGWTADGEIIWDDESNVLVKGSFVTEKLGVTYYEPEDNVRKANPEDKYKKMAQRRPKIFKTRFARWMMKREWGRKVMFFFFGRKRDVKSGWPTWVQKTDEERAQNLPNLFKDNSKEYIATEKIDGTSTTFTIRGRGRKQQFFVCSRNVVFDKPDKKCFYETNVYTEMAEKYDIENKLKELISENDGIDFITIQGETYGEGIQKRDYGLKEHKLAVFNVIIGYIDGLIIRLNPLAAKDWCEEIELPFVPIVAENFVLPATCDELLEYAASEPSKIDGGMREGLVFRDYNGEESFKAVSNAFLEKYHS
jgi:RNA ligase (TIGR02306 family)